MRSIKILAKGPRNFSKKLKHFGKGGINGFSSISYHDVAKDTILCDYTTHIVGLSGSLQYLLAQCTTLLKHIVKNSILLKYNTIRDNFWSFTKNLKPE